MVQHESQWAKLETEDMEAEERMGKLNSVVAQLEQEVLEAKQSKRRRNGPMAPAGPPPGHLLAKP